MGNGVGERGRERESMCVCRWIHRWVPPAPPPSVYLALRANDQVRRFINIYLHYITLQLRRAVWLTDWLVTDIQRRVISQGHIRAKHKWCDSVTVSFNMSLSGWITDVESQTAVYLNYFPGVKRRALSSEPCSREDFVTALCWMNRVDELVT